MSGRTPCVGHHVRGGGVGRKAGYEWIVPLTWEEHEELHRIGQQTFEARYGVDLEEEAKRVAQLLEGLADVTGDPDDLES